MDWRRLGTGLGWLLSWRFLEPVVPAVLVGYIAAGTGVVLVTGLIGAIISWSSIANVSMLYLLVVLATAVRFGSGPAVFASVAAFLAFDWFHIKPAHAFTVADPAEWVSLVLFLLVSTVTGQLAGAQRRRADEARRREDEARALYELGRILNAGDDLDAVLRDVAQHLRAQLGLAGCAILLPLDAQRGGRAVARAVAGAPPPAEEQSVAEWMVAPARSTSVAGPGRRWVRVHDPRKEAARGAPQRVTFVPLKAADRTVGVMRLAQEPHAPAWTEDSALADTRLIDAAADQIALAVERSRLRQEALENEVLRQIDAARKALLASVSHDLRTPLATIKASAQSLVQPDVSWSEAERLGFAVAIEQEADHLNRLVGNLLDMTRIEAGALRPEREWYPLGSLVDDVLLRLQGITARHRVLLDLPETLPPVPLDYVQLSQVVANLVENAVKYTPPGSHICLGARQQGDEVRVTVADDGPGIPAEALPQLFDKFFRVSSGDTARTPGTGLGLAVVRGIVEAHGGRVGVASPPPGQARGTVFSFTLPLHPAGFPAPGALPAASGPILSNR